MPVGIFPLTWYVCPFLLLIIFRLVVFFVIVLLFSYGFPSKNTKLSTNRCIYNLPFKPHHLPVCSSYSLPIPRIINYIRFVTIILAPVFMDVMMSMIMMIMVIMVVVVIMIVMMMTMEYCFQRHYFGNNKSCHTRPKSFNSDECDEAHHYRYDDGHF